MCRKNENKVKLYLCDRKRCETCSPECRHTFDIQHAIHPDAPDSDFLPLPQNLEKDKSGNIIRIWGNFHYWEKDGEVEQLFAEYVKAFGQERFYS